MKILDFSFAIEHDVLVVEENPEGSGWQSNSPASLVEQIEKAIGSPLHKRPIIIRLKDEDCWEIVDYRRSYTQLLYGGDSKPIAKVMARRKAEKTILIKN